jgi:PAS domain-containing protein
MKACRVDLRHTSIGVDDLPRSMLQYVLRTRERVLVQDASAESEFALDEYVRRHHTRSVLCIPLLKQSRLTGIIYLENNLISNAFTPARMALLEVLASDAAISLENASLYRDLQEGERESRLIVETIPGFVASLSPAGEIEFVNQGLIEYCGQGLEAMKQWARTGRFMLTICLTSSNSLPGELRRASHTTWTPVSVVMTASTDGFRFAGFPCATWAGRSSAGTPCSSISRIENGRRTRRHARRVFGLT